ncbi:xanthine dehydrogenase family protein molybdopterin-binding subunit [Halomarina halobia]|uniref:Xanthine dehydrogenase family protein molybdopterin-binding subunit n=2 Tax=Halomarina halobia TaxID=3033386 RepID=A0ABD6AEV0_9EURY
MIGEEVDRQEDPRLITGTATYIDDIARPRMVHAAILRSQFAHARINSIDTSEAERHPKVLAVYTATDLENAGVGSIPYIYRVPNIADTDHAVLAREKARYQGKPIAVVVAEDRYAAHHATDLISVDYERLEAVIDPTEAIAESAPSIHERAENNVAFTWETGDKQRTAEAFADADRTFSFEFENQRIVPNALDPRGAVAEYSSVTQELTVHLPSQFPFTHQEAMAQVLDHPKRKIRIITPDVGGGFGSKTMYYPGETLTAFCAMQLERPVKWIETRTEAFQADEHGRGQVIEADVAVRDGRISGLSVTTYAGIGGDLSSKGVVGAATTFGPLLSGQYTIPEIYFESFGVFTNATPTAPYRGVGRAEAAFTIERVMELVARELDEDPVEFRRSQFIPPEAFPYETPLGSTYDSGDYEGTLEKALEMVDYDEFRERQAELRTRGRYVGIGFSCFIEPGGFAPTNASKLLGVDLPESTIRSSFWESGVVRVHETGEVIAYCGTASHGQGSETTHAQVVADTLGVDVEQVAVTEGKDTKDGPAGSGSFGSRAAVMGGSALVKSAEKVVEKCRRIAAHRFDVPLEDVSFDRGRCVVRGEPDRSLTLAEIAVIAHLATDLPEGMEPGLEATSYFDPDGMTWSFGTHVAIVEVDPQTGDVDFERYVAVDDCGTQINPKIVDGQIHGGVAQGIGAALYEGAVYDDNGTLVNGSFQDYTLPKIEHVPQLELASTVTPSPLNPLGVKGVGEAGTIGAPPAVVNAVTDALRPFGIDHLEMPLTPEKVWRAVRDATDD